MPSILFSKKSKNVAIIATGMMVEVALRARGLPATDNISACVINIHTIKLLDEELVLPCEIFQ